MFPTACVRPRSWPLLRLALCSTLLASCTESSLTELADTVAPVQSALVAGPGIPNADHPSSELYKQISPVLSPGRHFNVPTVVNKTVFMSGKGIHEIWNISNPYAPQRMSEMLSPNRFGEAESHQVSFAYFPDGSLHAATISGLGIDLWNISNPSAPTLEKAIAIPGINYGDGTNAAWGVYWQGNYVYVGGTNTGLHVVDATVPTSAQLIKTVATSALGDQKVGIIGVLGNLLVVTTPKNSSGIVTVDISDPANPALLDVVDPSNGSYSGGFNGKHAFLLSPWRAYDVTTDPRNIVVLGSSTIPVSEYMMFGEPNMLFLGTMRRNSGGLSGIVKMDLTNPASPVQLAHIPGRDNPGTDDQFSVPVGNLLVIGDDEGLLGAWIGVHATARDTTAPVVTNVNPANGATGQPTTTRIGIAFSDQMELTSMSTSSFIVRPVGGGTALTGRWGYDHNTVNFWPASPLSAGVTYEVVLPAGGVKDVVGNAIASQFRSTFTVGAGGAPPPATCGINPLSAKQVNTAASMSATNPNTSANTYQWNFGDGGTATGASVSRTYTQAGRYAVVLTVTPTAGGAAQSCSAVQIVYNPLTATQPTRSNTVALSADGAQVWAVNSDSNTVTAVNATTRAKVFEVAAGTSPRTIARAADGTFWVVNQGSDSISVHQASNGALLKTIGLPYGSQPYGLAFTPDGSKGFVTLQALGRLVKLDPVARAVASGTSSVNLGPDADGIVPQIRGIAIAGDSTRVFITRFISGLTRGELYEVNAGTMAVVRTIPLVSQTGTDTPDRARGIPNYLSSITISPDGKTAWIPSKQDNMSRGTFRDGQDITHDSTVRPVVSIIDLTTNSEQLANRIDLNDADLPYAVQFSSWGDLAFVVNQGNNFVDAVNTATREVASTFSVGLAPQGLALTSAGHLFVNNFMGRTMSVMDVTGLLSGVSSSASTLGTTNLVSNELLSAQVLQGKRIFYNASDVRMSNEGYLSCASCHLDGGEDGRVWDFTGRGEGLRNTITLKGRSGMGHGPVHWTGNFNEIQDFENDIRAGFGGTGFLTNTQFNTGTRSDPLGDAKAGLNADLDALAAYVASLTTGARSPYRNADGSMTADAVAGKAIYDSLNCATCHVAPGFTNSALNVFRDVGTIKPSSGKRRSQTLTGFDVPTLIGAWETPPYFHDGSAKTLMDTINLSTHGNAAGLTATDKQKLVAYLQQLDSPAVAAGTKRALLVVANATSLTGGDTALRNRLETNLGFTVTLIGQSTAEPADVATYDVVVIAESIGSNLGNKYKTVATGVVDGDNTHWDNMGMAASTGNADLASQTQVAISNTASPLAAGLSGNVTAYTSGTDVMYHTTLGPNAAKVTTTVGSTTNVATFSYNAGQAMYDGTAAAGRRVGLGLIAGGSVSKLTTAGWSLVDAAINWAAE